MTLCLLYFGEQLAGWSFRAEPYVDELNDDALMSPAFGGLTLT
jgi:hypothetical protein